MKGAVLDFSIQANQGVISGEDGGRYIFKGAEWKGKNVPNNGAQVDFVISDGAAVGVYPAVQSVGGSKNKIVAGLLALFLGYLGLHKFYLGYKSEGLVLVAVFVFSAFFIFVQPLFFVLLVPLACLVSFIEFIIYVCKSDVEFDAVYVRGRRPWF